MKHGLHSPMRGTRGGERSRWAACAASIALGAACGDTDTVLLQPPPERAEPNGSAEPRTEDDSLGPVYALAVAVYSDNEPTGYLSISDTLERGDVSLAEAYEVPGYPSIQASGGQLFVARNEELTIERLAISADLAVQRQGRLSFVSQGVESVLFGDQYWQGERAAYLNLDVTQRVLWDPTNFAIGDVLEGAGLPSERDGLQLFASFNRTSFVASGDVLVPFSYHDQDWFVWSPETRVAVYDAQTHTIKHVIEAPCPALDSITRDEAGNTYLGTWEYSSLFPLMGTGAPPCAVRLRPDNTIDPGWETDLSGLTGGRLVKNFRYLGQGHAVAGVFHAEEYGEGYDFSTFAEQTDDFWAREGAYHRLWMFDLNTSSAAPVSGIEFEFVQAYFSHAVIDGRYFVFLADGSSNQAARTIAYELSLDGTATRRFEVAGDIRQWERVR